MSNSLVLISERVQIPATVSRADAPALARKLFGNVASCASAVSKTAARDSFVSQCVSLAISEMVSGDHSRLAAFESYAPTLPEYRIVKKDGAMVVSGKLGQLISAYRQAVSIGSMIRNHADFDRTSDEINLQKWLIDSASFGALIALPDVKKAATAQVSKSAPAESAPAESALAESAPAESAPAESAPAESAPAESAPAESAESDAVKNAPAELKITATDIELRFAMLLESNPVEAIAMLRRMAKDAGMALRKAA